MRDNQSGFELSSEEVAFLKRLAVREHSMEGYFSQIRDLSGGKHIITLRRTDAEVLRGHLTELLAKVGFESDYSLNEHGRMLEELIDRFHRP